MRLLAILCAATAILGIAASAIACPYQSASTANNVTAEKSGDSAQPVPGKS